MNPKAIASVAVNVTAILVIAVVNAENLKETVDAAEDVRVTLVIAVMNVVSLIDIASAAVIATVILVLVAGSADMRIADVADDAIVTRADAINNPLS